MVNDEQRPFPNFRQLIRRHLQYSPFSLRVITTDLTPPLSSRTVDKNDQGAAINCPQLQANWKLLLGSLSLSLPLFNLQQTTSTIRFFLVPGADGDTFDHFNCFWCDTLRLRVT